MFQNAIIVSTALCLTAVAAQDQRRGRRPPREAVDACEDASQGDDCTFEGRDQEEVSGTCERPPNDTSKPLACRPPHPPEEGEDSPEEPQTGGAR